MTADSSSDAAAVFSREELYRFLESYRDGTLDEAAARQLARCLRDGGEGTRWMLEELAFSGLLGQAMSDVDEAGFVRSFVERLAAEKDNVDDFSVRLTARARDRVRQHRAGRRAAFIRAALRLLLPDRGKADEQRRSPGRIRTVLGLAGGLAMALAAIFCGIRTLTPTTEAELLEYSLGVQIVRSGVKMAPTQRMALRADDVVRVPSDGSALLYFADTTWIRLRADAAATLSPTTLAGDRHDRCVELVSGQLEAEVKGPPAGRGMHLVTPHASLTVHTAGRLTVSVTGSATQLETAAGSVSLTRRNDGRRVDVPAGYFVIAAAGTELTVMRR